MIAQPSTIAASTTWPRPVARALRMPLTSPSAMNSAPPPTSPTMVAGIVGGGAALAGVVQDAGQRDVVQVVARRGRERTRLPPSGQPAEDQARVAGEAHLGPETETLHHARAKPLDQPVRLLDEAQHHLGRAGRLEVERDGALAAAREVELRIRVAERQHRALAIDDGHFRTEIRQHHAADRAGADARHLDDAHAGERPHHSVLAMISRMTSLAPP